MARTNYFGAYHKKHSRCPTCSAPSDVSVYRHPRYGDSRRVTKHCDRCGRHGKVEYF